VHDYSLSKGMPPFFAGGLLLIITKKPLEILYFFLKFIKFFIIVCIMKTKSDYPDLNKKPPLGIKPDGSFYKVLIIDDSMFVIKQLTQILTSEKFEVVGTASNGVDGFEKYKELSPQVDIVTLDITMPKMDGIATLEKILEFDSKALVVMVSALGKENLVKEAIMLGAKNYIIKPIDRTKVLERIAKILNK
jgi:two-component system, chemotaxis family, chemotaxis protein CheY